MTIVGRIQQVLGAESLAFVHCLSRQNDCCIYPGHALILALIYHVTVICKPLILTALVPSVHVTAIESIHLAISSNIRLEQVDWRLSGDVVVVRLPTCCLISWVPY